MEGILKVTPEKLIGSSDEFAQSGEQLKSLTTEMMNLVQGLKGIWQGDANTAYSTRFGELQTDMDKLYRMIAEHAKDLNEMATSYMKAESGNVEHGQSMVSGIIV